MPHEIDGQPHWHEPAGDDLAGLAAYPRPASPYERFMAEEGLPVARGIGFGGLDAVALAPWRRVGGRGGYVQLHGTEGRLGCHVLEVPGGASTLPERHLFEELLLVADGRGSTELWRENGERHVFEWQRGALFAIPRNAHHRLVNAGSGPARLIGFTTAPVLIDHLGAAVFHSRMMFDDPLDGTGQMAWDEVEPDPIDGLARTRTRLLPDAIGCDLPLDNRASPGHRRLALEMTGGMLPASLGQHRQGRYGRAVRMAPGAVSLTLAGRGETLLWPARAGVAPWADGHDVASVAAGPFGMVSLAPFGEGFAQSLNALGTPLRELVVGLAPPAGVPGETLRDLSRIAVAEGGAMVPYWAEDPFVRARHAALLAEAGAANRMHPAFYVAP